MSNGTNTAAKPAPKGFVVRSMSTTDWTPKTPSVPYHIFLLKPEKRTGAYWARYGDIAVFATAQEARAERDRLRLTHAQVVPLDGMKDLPNYWDDRSDAA